MVMLESGKEMAGIHSIKEVDVRGTLSWWHYCKPD